MSKPKNKVCYERDYLHQYLVEKLSEADEAEVRDHLDDCRECQQEMEHAAGDHTMWQSLKEHISYSPVTPNGDERIQRLIEFLAPTEDPAMLGRLGKYEVVGLIGQGSTGIVLKALERGLNRYVAIKVLSPIYSNNGAARKRFEREGRAVAAVTNEHVVPIFAVDEFRGLPYIVMQYVPGVSLLQRMEKDGPLDTCEVTRIGLQVAKGLEAAHAQGIVHRDVKPANVLLEETVERAMVTDFGLARVADEASMTRSGTIAGTPSYMSPEQAKGDAVDPRSDLFSLGSLMYAACTARPPFRAETLFGVINRVCSSEPRPIREINPRIDEWLVVFINRLISKQPEHRFQSATDVATELSSELAHLQNPTVVPHPTREWMPKPKKSKTKNNHSKHIAVATLIFACVAMGALAYSDLGSKWLGLGAVSSPPEKDSTLLDDEQQKQEWVETTGSQDEDEGQPRTFWKANQVDFDTNASQTFDQKVEQTFMIKENGNLNIQVGQGDIVVQPSELSDRVQVTVLRRVVASSQAEAELIIKKHQIDMTAQKAKLTVTGNFAEGVSEEDAKNQFKNVLYRVSVPKRFNHVLNTENGSVTVGALAGNVEAEAINGGIDLGRIDGDVELKATGGNIHLNEGTTGEAFVMGVRSNAYVSNVDQEATVRMSGGNAWIGGCKGPVRGRTSGGNIKVTEVVGPVRVHTSDGDVVVNLLESPTADSSFTATNGDVTIRLRDDVKASLFEINVEEGESENPIDQELNGGGSKMEVGSTIGTVELKVLNSEQAKGLGGSGLGGSGSGKTPTAAAIAKTKGDPRPGAIATIRLDESEGMDGYTLYLPPSHGVNDKKYPILVYLQGAWGVGGPIENVNLWGMMRLLRDESDLTSERNQLLLDTFIVVAPHINGGQYHGDADKVQAVIDEIADKYHGDLDRVYATGVSRGGHGSWGLASKLPDTFAAIAPMGGSSDYAEDFSVFKNIAVWIGHNQGDATVEFEEASRAVTEIEERCDVEFLRIEKSGFADTSCLENRYVLSAPKIASHDIWTDTYTSVEFYQWLLKQNRGSREVSSSSSD